MRQFLIRSFLLLLASVLIGCSGTPPPPPKTPSQSDKYLSNGKIIYSIPDTMIVDQEYLIEVRISEELNFSDLKKEIENENENFVIKDSIQVSMKMEVQLKDLSVNKSIFEFNELTPSNQVLFADGFTFWKWKVKPLAKGVYELGIVVNAIIPVYGIEEFKTIKVLDKRVSILSKSDFLSFRRNWLYFDLALIIILIYSSVRYFRKKKLKKYLKNNFLLIEAKKRLRSNKVEESISFLEKYTLTNNLKDANKSIMIVLFRFKEFRKKETRNTISFEKKELTRNQIIENLLEIISDLEKNHAQQSAERT